MRNRKGFSLIELIAIIIIIGLILIVAIPAVTQLLKVNNNKQYEQYLEVVKAGALRYSEELKDDLGGYSDTGCIEVALEELIKENMIKEYNDKDITCTGSVRLNNIKGNVSASVNLSCKNKRSVTTYEVKETDGSACDKYVPGDDDVPSNDVPSDDNSGENSNENITLVNKILTDNTAYADNVSSPYVSASTGIDFSAINSDTNGKGLYYTSTNTENNNKTYYFRGAVTNNIVQFGTDSNGNKLYWKIIRINEDGSVRLIYNGTSASTTGSATTIGTSAFNSSNQDNAYVGYMYGTTGSSTHAATHANNNPSTMKTYLDTWYENNLKTNYSSYLADAGFCNDRSIASSADSWYSTDTALGYGTNYTYYGAFNRLKNKKQPQFKCPNASNDLFTTTSSSKGNKKLTYPIGLITADEVAYAGGVGSITATNSSMYLSTGNAYYTMSPYVHEDDTYQWTFVYAVASDGAITGGLVTYTTNYSVRPVINLKSTVILSNTMPSGCASMKGTASCPYVVA